MYDIIIIGAGITGSILAHDLSKYQLKVAVIDKENDVAQHATGANSAMIHSGHDPKPGTLKERFNVEGNRMYPTLCQELQVAYQEIGAIVVSTNQEESEILDQLEKQTKERQIPYQRLNQEEIRKKEPHIQDHVIDGLFLPTTGIVTPWEVTIAAMEEAVMNDVSLFLNTEVTGIDYQNGYYVIHTNQNDFKAKTVVNAAGVYADHVTSFLHSPEYHIRPRKGEYYVLSKPSQPIVNHIIYPVPSQKGKGVLVVPTIHGNVLLGPNSEFCDDKEATNTTKDLDYVKQEVGKTVKDIPVSTMIRNFAGLRPTGDTGDFVIKEDEEYKGFIHVACIESPGLTSAPAISQYIIHELLQDQFTFQKKESYQKRKTPIIMNKLSIEQQNELIKKNPAYGRMICRCEKISEGEIIDVIHRPVGATTVDGVKKRCRPGMGGCQGGFCENEVVKILARELGKNIEDIEYKAKGSYVISSQAKEEL